MSGIYLTVGDLRRAIESLADTNDVCLSVKTPAGWSTAMLSSQVLFAKERFIMLQGEVVVIGEQEKT